MGIIRAAVANTSATSYGLKFSSHRALLRASRGAGWGLRLDWTGSERSVKGTFCTVPSRRHADRVCSQRGHVNLSALRCKVVVYLMKVLHIDHTLPVTCFIQGVMILFKSLVISQCHTVCSWDTWVSGWSWCCPMVCLCDSQSALRLMSYIINEYQHSYLLINLSCRHVANKQVLDRLALVLS